MTEWKEIGNIVILLNDLEKRKLYAARIREKGLTAYGDTFDNAVESLLRLKKAQEEATP